MGSPPAWLLIEPLLVALDAIPTQEVRPIVLAYRLDYVHGFAVATFATVNSVVLDSHRSISRASYYVHLSDERQSQLYFACV
jgi:hypothetical protein